MSSLVLVLGFVVLLILQRAVIARFAFRGFHYERRFSQKTAIAGDTITFTEVIRNRKPLFLPWLRIESNISPYLQFKSEEELDIRFDRFHKSVFTLPAFSQVTRKHPVKLHHRGHFVLQDVTVTCGDLLGISNTETSYHAPAELHVYPKLLPDDPFFTSQRYQGDESVRRFIIDDPFLVNGIRTYRVGDPVRDIHWAATARMNELQVKTHDFTADPKLMVILNCQNREDQWGELMDYEQEQIEHGISLMATICMKALKQGTEAGFAANMPLEGSEECACVMPVGGAGAEDMLLSAMSLLQVRRARRFPMFLESLSQWTGMDIIILSCYESEEIHAHIQHLRRAGNQVQLMLLKGGKA